MPAASVILEPHRTVHSRGRALLFDVKVALLRLDRARREIARGGVPRHAAGGALAGAPVIGLSISRLWTEASAAERPLLVGKIENLRVALRAIDGVVVPAGAMFSFWAQIGRPTRRRGYVAGRELREGCIVPSVGGGLCQLSNALYDAALTAGFDIVERHAHSQVIPGSLAEIGRDATVFWNYVDLRFRAPADFRIEADMDAENLVIRFRAEAKQHPSAVPADKSPLALVPAKGEGPHNCLSCNVVQCFRSEMPKAVEARRSAFLLDGVTPEFDAYVQAQRAAADALFIPLDGRRFRRPNYAWSSSGFAAVKTATLQTLWRAFKSRRVAAQGAERQRTLLATARALAEHYAKRLDPEATHLVIAQPLLPHLWLAGHLKGRTFDVLMSALPMDELQRRLDRAAAKIPGSRTLADFRADAALVAAERAALERARRIVTPHADIAALFPVKAVRLDWAMPKARIGAAPAVPAVLPRIVFPASALGRKGAQTVAAALRGLDVVLVTLGRDLDGGTWDGIAVEQRSAASDWLARVSLVVLPAHVEHNPRALLKALANGVPVIASRECGIAPRPGLTLVRAGDADELRAAILAAVDSGERRLAFAA